MAAAARIARLEEVATATLVALPGRCARPSCSAHWRSAAEHVRRRYGRPVPVWGHSTGGAIARQLALTAPHLVARLLLVDIGAHMTGHGDVETILGDE